MVTSLHIYPLLLGPMSFFRSYIAPLLIVLIFAVAMLAVSARIFLPSDMMAPAPVEDTLSTLPILPLVFSHGLGFAG